MPPAAIVVWPTPLLTMADNAMAGHTHTYPNPNPRILAFLTVLMAAPQQHINAIEIWLHAILTLRSTRTHTDSQKEKGDCWRKWEREMETQRTFYPIYDFILI